MSPLDVVSPRQMISGNKIGGNSGNMIFPHSLFRVLMTENTQIDTIKTSRKFSSEEARQINENYDYFVIPLANGFRSEFRNELRYLANLVDKLTIPCVVIGVGVQADVDNDMTGPFDFDDASKVFVKSILKRSATIGIRGEMTAEYLKRLGFREESDFTVIGCPSMYMWGDQLPEPRAGELTPNSFVSTNRKPPLSDTFHNFMVKSMEQLPNHYFLPQNLADILLLYAGVPLSLSKHKNAPSTYPQMPAEEIFLQDRVRAFMGAGPWLEFLRQAQLSFGSRIHGNITAVLAGTPAFIFACDSRVRELAEYHKIQHMLMKDMTEDLDIFEIYEKADFQSVHQGHKERFTHFADFLQKNGLEYVSNLSEGIEVPFDKALAKLDMAPDIHSLFTRSYEEQADILAWYDTWMAKKIAKGGAPKNMRELAKQAYKLLKK